MSMLRAYFKKPIALLVIIVLIGSFIRLYNLADIPSGFHEDEAHIGYNAYSLLKTGKDKNGVFLPLAIDQFGDFRPSGLHFLTVPSVAAFGLNEFATRFPVAIFGILSIIVLYFLSLEIFKNKAVSVIAAAMLSLNPWHIIASRSTSESIVSLFFVMLGIFWILKAIRVQKKQLIIFLLGFVSLFISFLFYHAARYFVPFFLVYLFYLVLAQKKTRVVFAVFGAILAACLLFLMTYSSGAGRPAEISIFSTKATDITLYRQKMEDIGQNPLITRFFHNKFVDYSFVALTNYGKHFSPDFLFFQGGLPPRYMVPWNGNFYLVDGIFILSGLFFLTLLLYQKEKSTSFLFIPVVWVLLGPIPAAFTFEDIPHFQRSIMMLPGLILIAAYGAYMLAITLKGRRRQVILSVLGILLAYNLLSFMHDYFHHLNLHNAIYRNEGEKDLVLSLKKIQKDYSSILVTSANANNLIFYLFYDKIDPAYFQSIGSPRDKDGLRFQGMTFVTQDCPSYNTRKIEKTALVQQDSPTIFVDKGECLIYEAVETVKNVKRSDGTVAYRILKLKPGYTFNHDLLYPKK